MSNRRKLAALPRDERGGAVIEFAILAPLLLTMLVGVLMVGIQLQNYNALRSVAYDVSRYTVVEYQKSNKLDKDQIENVAFSIASHLPYGLASDRLDVDDEPGTTGITGASKFDVTYSYTPQNFLGYIHPPTITYTQTIIVPA
jgi:Flp pilus assembly protein TadG